MAQTPWLKPMKQMKRSGRRRYRALPVIGALAIAGASLGSAPLAAQASRQAVPIALEAFAGSAAESYLRVLQDLGEVPLYPWSIRPFSPREMDRLAVTETAHPWSGFYTLHPDTVRGLRFRWVPTTVSATYNTGFPYGFNDGPLWAGRGLTTALQGGAAVRYGPFSLMLDPIVFRAENAAFDLSPNGQSGRLAFADAAYPTTIDLPRRFGAHAYQRFGWGESTLRIDLPFVTAGVSTANQVWGPAQDFPLILGNNASGFPHAFIGTASPVYLWVGKVHARVVWGDLQQSEYSSVEGPGSRRFMSGLVAVFVPRGVPGLEVGAARFYHTPWPTGGLEWKNFTKPFEGFLKVRLPDTGIVDGKSDADNQLASLFARWVFPHSGFEVYGEYAREDHNWDLRDLTLEPDHDSGYMFGLQRVFRLRGKRLLALRAEVLNTRASHLERVRPQTYFYRHSPERQGHTERGQILGSPAAYGGTGALLAADYYLPRGRLSLSWNRQALRPGSASVDDAPVIQNALGVESAFGSRFGRVRIGLTGVRESNPSAGSSALNLNSTVGLQWSW